MTQVSRRLPSGGRVDRAAPVPFQFAGTGYTGFAGDTLAAALLAAGVRRMATSVRFGRPRGVVAAGSEEPSAVVQVVEPFPEPMLPATTLEIFPGLVAEPIAGRGRLAGRPDLARYDAVHAHCDLLVVGAGPAGLAAAAVAAAGGARVLVADERAEPGGLLPGTGEWLDGAPATDWVAATVAELARTGDARLLRRTTVLGCYDDNYCVAVERRTNHLGLGSARIARERVWRIRARQVLLATGAHERLLAFPDNDRPGVMLAGAVREYVHRYAVLPGERAVVVTTNDAGYQVALSLAGAGVAVPVVADARPEPPARWLAACAEGDIEVLAGYVPAGTAGPEELSGVTLVPLSGTGGARLEDADLLAVAGGWNPVTALYTQAGGRLGFDDRLGAFLPAGVRPALAAAGAARGVLDTAGCLADGAAAGRAALAVLGRSLTAQRPLPHSAEPAPEPGLALWAVGAPEHAFVDLQRDVTVAEVHRAVGAGLRSVEHVKRYTTAGTAHDQGKTSGVLTTGVVATALGAELAGLGTTTARPPYTPVAFAALAGRERGELHDPVRTTQVHDWHVQHGAVFEDVGQWKRPRYYPQPGEDMSAAVRRECRAARKGVAFMDASTLGKIDVHGPDAAELLDRLYPNLISSLAVGSIRYGVMCRLDGMVFDDGTVIRLGEDRFLVTTTTGNAAPVLDWMEEWLQTEWPQLRVHCTSVTEQWATLALVGPRSREVLAGLAPDLAVDAAAFPFMTWRDTTVAGIPARVCRISFSGELAYELNVSGWSAPALWAAVEQAGRPLGLTPYGTETMHVLRAEKGYPIIGQDTDGTVTPDDLGLGWAVSKKKPDFVGKRSLARPDTARPDRKQLVGLLPEDPAAVLAEGAQLVAGPEVGTPPVPMLGHVTSSYYSAALDRGFALGLLRSGRDRFGELLYAVHAGRDGAVVTPVRVTSPVLYDPDGTRRDG